MEIDMKFTLDSIPEGKERGWVVRIDGEEVQVGHIELTSTFGTLEYGLHPEGYDSWVFREAGGGGSVLLPYAIDETGELWVGLLKESRPHMGGMVFCAIGGFKSPNESNRETQQREAWEEAGIDGIEATQLPGCGTNSNRVFFVADAQTEGTIAYALKLPFSLLRKADDEGLMLKDAALQNTLNKPDDVRFFHWKHAARTTADAMARSAILQLLTTILP